MKVVYITTGPSTSVQNGLVSLWGECTTKRGLYPSLVTPWFNDNVKRLMYNVFHHTKDPDTLINRPGIHLVNITPQEFKEGSASFELKVKAPGSAKEFAKAKRDGKIVLKPYLAYKLNGRSIPSVKRGQKSPQKSSTRLSLSTIGATPVGFCDHRFVGIPALELDTNQTGGDFNYTRYEDPIIEPVDQATLDSIGLDIISHLERLEPNGQLVTKTVADANSATFDLATEIGEMPETIKMIVDAVKAGVKLLLRYKKEVKQNLSSGSVITDAASLWMGTRYGIMPVVYSINDGLSLLNMEARKFQSFRGRSDSPAPVFDAHGYTCVSAPSVQDRCFLKYGYDLDSLISQDLKLNIASTAWELIPLSFIWDWFFQIGDFLTAYFTPGSVEQIGCTYSYRVNGEYVFRNEDNNSTITYTVDYYRSTVIKPDSFIGVHSDVFISYKRAIDAISLSWLLFKKTAK